MTVWYRSGERSQQQERAGNGRRGPARLRLHRAATGGDDVLHHRQAEPGPREPRTRSARKNRSKRRGVLLGDARPVVRDRQTAGGDGDGERAPGPA